jgi:subtilisin family serine protease
MNRLPSWLRRWLPAARTPRTLRRSPLAIETLESRVVPTTSLSYQQWAQQRIHLDDVTVAPAMTVHSAAAQTAATNNSFGSLIGLNQVLAGTSYRGAGYSVAVIDTGINYNDPNLGGGWGKRVIAGWNFINNTGNPLDDNGHGTFVASEIASSSSTYSGIAPDVNLVALKVLDNTGSGTYANVLSALNWVVAHRTQYNIIAVNLSLGSGNYTVNPYTYLESDFATLKSAGVFIAVAAGNDYYTDNGQPGLDYPAVSSNVVSVGAVWDGSFGAVAWANGARDTSTAADQIVSFSQRSAALSILAPGAIITGDSMNGSYITMAGTSMATPVITGAAVILHEALVDSGLSGDANQDYILGLMQSTGKTIVDSNHGTDNVAHTGLTFHRINLAAALAALGTPVSPTPTPTPPVQIQPPTLATIANQTITTGQTLTLQLSASDPNGLTLSYTATVPTSSSPAYQLKTSLGLVYAGSYYTNLMGAGEKWISSSSSQWYCLLPDGELRRWAGTWAATLQPTAFVANLGSTYYANPSLLLNATGGSAPATVSVSSGGVLTLKPAAGYVGSFTVQITVSNGTKSVTQSFSVAVVPASSASPGLPALGAIPNQTVRGGATATVQLNATSPGGAALTYTVSVTSITSQAVQLKTSLGLQSAGSYYTNLMGAGEKWIFSSASQWYCLLPNGDLRRWAGSWTATMQPTALVASLGAAYYANPNLLLNAQQVTSVGTVTVSGGKLIIQPAATFRGTFVVRVTVSNGSRAATQTCTVTVTA